MSPDSGWIEGGGMNDWKQRAAEMRKCGMSITQIAKDLCVDRSMMSRFLNYGHNEYTMGADDEFVAVREPRVPRRIIKGSQDIMALARLFIDDKISREELMKGIAA